MSSSGSSNTNPVCSATATRAAYGGFSPAETTAEPLDEELVPSTTETVRTPGRTTGGRPGQPRRPPRLPGFPDPDTDTDDFTPPGRDEWGEVVEFNPPTIEEVGEITDDFGDLDGGDDEFPF